MKSLQEKEISINRMFLIILSALLLGCSTSIPVGTDPDHAMAEQYLAKKAVILPVEIQHKTEPILDQGLGVRISLLDLTKEELPVIDLYHNSSTRDAVKEFFVKVTDDEEVALTTLYYADRYGINPFLVFSLVYTESRFVTEAINYNPGSVDRGLFQLNNKSFPRLSHDDFFNIDVNVRMGIQHLSWCLTQAKGNEEKALAIYNAGYGRVRTGDIPRSTQEYVKKIKRYRKTLASEFRSYISDFFLADSSEDVNVSLR